MPPAEARRAARRGTIRAIRPALLRWYGRHRRDLPWRRTSDPYAIWVAEVMLQQTQVATVVPYFRRFLERFPDAASLARADEEEVLARWSGLGYYRRARALHAGAREVVRRHAGRVPADPAALLALPGIGRYTAGAIASIAFSLAEPILDGNVRRVLSRLFAAGPAPADQAGTDAGLWELAAELVRGPRPGDLNQALMELGAVVCTPRSPACPACPVAASCRARALGTPEAFPVAKARRPATAVDVAVAWVTRGSRVLLERPGADSPLRGAWDLPAFEGPAEETVAVLRRRHGLLVRAADTAGSAGHGIMNRRLLLSIIPCRVLRGRTRGRVDLCWVDPGNLEERAVSGATLKIARRFT